MYLNPTGSRRQLFVHRIDSRHAGATAFAVMRWDERLAGLLDDLEQQAEGLALADRDVEVAEALRAEYSQVDLASRVLASLDTPLRLTLSGVGAVDGVLRRAGDGWCLIETEPQRPQEWVVRLGAVTALRGLADRGLVASAGPLTARLGLGSALRGVAETRTETVVHRVDGSMLRGALGRVGGDFVEVVGAGDARGPVDVVPFDALAAVRSA
jgi:hypothetical protein